MMPYLGSPVSFSAAMNSSSFPSSVPLQLNKKGATEKYIWMTCLVKDTVIELGQKKLVSDYSGTEEGKLEEFIAALKETGEPRYGIIDYRNKVFFVSWIPEASSVREKML